jgi:outer membrane protein assembly factor BamB
MNRSNSLVLVLSVLVGQCSAAHLSVVMNRYDNFGTGANPHEKILNSSNVQTSTFGKLFRYEVDGSVYAQPLYVPGVKIPGRGTHNVVYVATMNDHVYAFDADTAGSALWERDLTNTAGITSVPIVDITHNNNLNIVGNVGILGTPVIDESTQTLYLVARTKEKGTYVQRLHAFDIRDGRDLVTPVVIQATVRSTASDAVNGILHFNPKTNNQRPALTLTHHTILIAWASHEDIKPYHGWIIAYDAKNLRQAAVFCTTPSGIEGGVWQSGRGAVVDRSGNIYYEIGNGDWNGTTDFGESLVKLRIRKGRFDVLDYYTPANYQALNKRDADFGSSGPALIPKTDVMICGDKHGVLTLLNTRDLGKLNPGGKQLLQSLPVNGGRVLNGPALWKSSTGLRLFLWGEADVPKAFRFQGPRIDPIVVAKGTVASHGSPGGALTVSSDGSKAGTGVLWAMLTLNRSADHGNAAGVLRAFDANTLQELWNSEQDPRRDRLGTLVKFVPPTVAAGKVYAATYDNSVMVYGELSSRSISEK